MASVALNECGNCAARFRFAVHHPTLGMCCPICLRSVGHTSRSGVPRPVSRRLLRVSAGLPRDLVAKAQAVGAPSGPAATVYTDASFDGDVAGLAVAGALGEHVVCTACGSSTRAERWALELALELADMSGLDNLVFRLDCLTIVEAVTHGRLQHILPSGRGWTVEHVTRDRNKRAHILARQVRRTGTASAAVAVAAAPTTIRPAGPAQTPGAQKQAREWLEAHPVPRWSPADRRRT